MFPTGGVPVVTTECEKSFPFMPLRVGLTLGRGWPEDAFMAMYGVENRTLNLYPVTEWELMDWQLPCNSEVQD